MPTYIRPLAMNKKGQSLLKNIKKNSSLPIVTKVGSMENITDKSLLLDIKASDIYSIICESEMETDFKLPVQIL